MFENLTGWKENQIGISQTAKQFGTLGQVASELIGGTEKKEVFLWRALLKLKPSWRRGAQGLGDCVAWGCEGDTTTLMAIQDIAGEGKFIEEAATEPAYGGARVEAMGVKAGGFSDGATGYGAAKWVKNYGVMLRLDYSKDTGNPAHNLSKYDKHKAKQWGNFGCGGQGDNGKLDAIAKEHPVKAIAQIKKIDQAIAALSNGYPFTIASMAGFGQMRRDEHGVCRWVDSWSHMMFVWGLRWRNGKPEFRICQSWGDCVSGPDPGIKESLVGVWEPNKQLLAASAASIKPLNIQAILPSPDFPCVADMTAANWNPISATSWWCLESDMAKILANGDNWVYSDVENFKKRDLDILKAAQSWYEG